MSTQISVRLPDELVHSLDAVVREAGETSRASVIERALARELRRWRYEQEQILLAKNVSTEDADDLEALSSWAGERFHLDD